MNTRLANVATFIRPCSVCFQSFADHWCHMMCDGNQSELLTILRDDGDKIRVVSMRIAGRWLKSHIGYCMRYGILKAIYGMVMDDTCVEEEECSPTSWLDNLNELIPFKLIPIHVHYHEQLDRVFDGDFNFTCCPRFQVHVSL